jgi:primosomal protein N' (replication factor Y)
MCLPARGRPRFYVIIGKSCMREEYTLRFVTVLINIPVKAADNYYTYHISEDLENELAFGKRVLVEWGRRKVEGYIIDDQASSPGIDTKPVLSILDREPVLNPELYQLALWLAETCMCPLTIAINTMIPRKLSQKSGRRVISLMTAESFSACLQGTDNQKQTEFLEYLFEHGDISYRKALNYIDAGYLKTLEDQDLIHISGVYTDYRDNREQYVYLLNDLIAAEDLNKLKVRAPRQAEIIQLLQEQPAIPCKELDKSAPASSIKSLLDKGYIKKERQVETETAVIPVLNPEQEQVLAAIDKSLSIHEQREFLLYGVTGSGKTEVYIRAALQCIARGRKVIVLVPEIALTRHLLEVFRTRIPAMAVMHSRMSPGERYQEYKEIKEGNIELVMGTRSAIFAPVSDIGLIIIDEEQEYTYKQEQQPRYHAREVARERARKNSAVLLLGSATPAVETFFNSEIGHSQRLDISIRAGDATMPVVTVADMRKSMKRGSSSIISPLLEEKINHTLERKEQCILFLNRRGFSPFTICRSCGHSLTCPNCSVGLNYHKDQNLYLCHYCGFNTAIPNTCPACSSSYIQQSGYGTQRVEEEIYRLFPNARIARLDLDSSTRKDQQKQILEDMKKGEIDLLIGTQMVAKGLDFPGVSLVGILDADAMLALPDFRSGERGFQLLVQAAGRAGRGSISGEVIIQTYNPDNRIIEMAATQNYLGFYQEEINWRKLLKYPPFTSLLRVVVVSINDTLAHDVADMIVLYINEITDAKEDNIVILGPAPCALYRIKNRLRYQLIVKSENMILLNSIGTYIAGKDWHKQVRVEIDLNPLMIM